MEHADEPEFETHIRKRWKKDGRQADMNSPKPNSNQRSSNSSESRATRTCLGEAIERQPQEVLIKADLRAFLAKQYAADQITPQEIEAVIKQLEAYSAADLYESNKAIMKLVSDGFLLKREDRSQKDLYIQLIDYSELVAFREPNPGEVPTIVAEDERSIAAAKHLSRSSISWRSSATRSASRTASSTSTACPWWCLNSRARSARRRRFTMPSCN